LPLPSEVVRVETPVDLSEGTDLTTTRRRASASDVVHRVHGMSLRAEGYTGGGPVTLRPGEAVVRVRPMKDGKPQSVEGVTCVFVSPLTDAHVRGKVTVVVEARNARGGEGELKVDIFAGGVALEGVKKTARGYEVEWDASKAKPGVWHDLSAIATDADGNKTEARTAVFVRE
jgi:hypothetical protein